MKVQADGFAFEFPGALDVFVFDEKNKSQPHFHGLSHAMKAVDLVVELPNDTLFVEVKDFEAAPDDYNFPVAAHDGKDSRQHLLHLRKVLVQKFRDTWLYRWAERPVGSPDKPVSYLCLLTLDNGLLRHIEKDLCEQLPFSKVGSRWQRRLADRCVVLNPPRWNSLFPAWPLQRTGTG